MEPSFHARGVPPTNMPLSRLQPIRRLAAIGLAALCGCQPAPPIKVGFIGGLSGRVSELAIDGRNGAQLAIETLNAQRRAALRAARPRRRPRARRGAPAVVDAAADEGDAFAIGPMTSVLAHAHGARGREAPPGADQPDRQLRRAERPRRLLLPRDPAARARAPSRSPTPPIARGLRTAAVMVEWRNRAYSESFAHAFARRFQVAGRRGRPTSCTTRPTRTPTTPKIAAAAAVHAPALVLLVCSAIDAAIVAQQLRRLDPDVQLAMASWAANVQLLQLGGRAIEGALVLQALDLDSPAAGLRRLPQALRDALRQPAQPGRRVLLRRDDDGRRGPAPQDGRPVAARRAARARPAGPGCSSRSCSIASATASAAST